MKHSIILDACTIINLLRIDEDGFLFKSLMSLDLNIASTVYEEVNGNIKKNKLSEKQEKYIEQVIPAFLRFSRQEKDIVKDLTEDYFNNLCVFVKHNKKMNGELFSSALSLCISREQESKVYFYTDDFPAKEQFLSFFSFQQIGVIGDSVDLLIFLYWVKSDFEKKHLRKILQDLKSEYNIPLKKLINKIQAKKDTISREQKNDRNLMKNIDKILNGYWRQNQHLMTDGFSFFNDSSKYADIRDIIRQYPNINMECMLSKKVEHIITTLSLYDIFKIA